MKNVAFALFLVPLPTIPALAGSLTGGDKPTAVAEGADVRVGSVGVGVGERNRNETMATSICPREGTAITTTTAADQAQTFQFGPITLSRSDDLKRTLIFFRQCKLGASLRRVWPRRRRSRRDGSCDNRSRSQERCTWPSGRYWVTTQDRGFGGRMRGALSVTDPRLWL